MTPIKTILWSHPRSRSTAFERAFIERGDFCVVHEPTSLGKYFGYDTHALLAGLCLNPTGFQEPLRSICHYGNEAQHLFIKDFAYHCLSELTDSFLSQFQHTFLVRHPEQTVTSFHEIHPDFEGWEAGYAELLQLMRRLEVAGHRIAVVDSDGLAANPNRVFRRYCQFLGLEFSNRMTQWETRPAIPSWERWERFHRVALESTSIKMAVRSGKITSLPNHRRQLVRELLPLYEDIKQGARLL